MNGRRCCGCLKALAMSACVTTSTSLERDSIGERRSDCCLEWQALGDRALHYLEREVWPGLPPSQIGRTLTRQEEDEILGYGPEGY